MNRQLGNAYIIDNGAYSVKVESSNKSVPRVIPNCIMKAKSEKRRPFIGDQIEECRDASGLFYILGFQKGYLVNWDVQKTVWDYIFSDLCCKGNFKETPVIVTEPYFNFPSIQEAMIEMFFEEYDCQSLLRINPGDLSAYNYFKNNPAAVCCLVVDSGYSFTHIIPYIKRKKYREGIIRIDVGGKLLTNHLKEIISYRQLHVMDETYVINQVKEDCCFVSTNFKQDMYTTAKKLSDNNVILDYVLPDFTTIRRGHSLPIDQTIQNDYQKLRLNNERFTVPELLFNPSDIGIRQAGVSEAIVTSVGRCPPETHSYLFANIVLTGGNMKFPGVRERVYNDVRSFVSEEYDINVHLPKDPVGYAWCGGVHMSQETDFHSLVVSKEEYEEEGSNICYERFDI